MKDPFLGEDVVLREVRQAFAAKKGERVGVIIEPRIGHSTQEIVTILENMNIKDIRLTDFYVSAELSESEVNRLAESDKVFKVWYNKEIKPMVDISSNTIKSKAALRLFGADGEGISWAILDTGIKANHKYFQEPPAIEKKVDTYTLNFTTESHDDIVGHGTHVAGIIRKLAPKVRMYDFKVLGKGGSTAFTIIQAMFTIRKINFDARQLVIHGANLSLGGYVQVGSYGTGYSPECQEANRLSESGVVICVAAGNEGHQTLATMASGGSFKPFPVFIDIGISDPGNADKVITVGSTHKVYPHRYGISFFSSRGPTGDGRYKPDVVAPGERIKSAGIGSIDEEVELSGTSMATPHVSAAIAQFLSVKKDFIGNPDAVKRIIMDNCTDLGRDRYFQGAGLIDVIRMIQAV